MENLFKLLMIGGSGVGKSSLLLGFTAGTFDELSPTIGVDFKEKYVTAGGAIQNIDKFLLQRRQGVVLGKHLQVLKKCGIRKSKSTRQIKTARMLVGNKADKESQRVVTKKEGIELAREYGCLFIECVTTSLK